MSKLEQEIEYARIALTNAQSNLELQGTLALLGYGPERIQQGLVLYQSLVDLVRESAEARQAKVASTQAFYDAWSTARLLYSRDLEIMRVVLRNQIDQSYYLQLPGKRNTSFAGWFAQAQRLYQALQDNERLLVLLASSGINTGRVAEGFQALENVSRARAVQSEQEGVTQVLVQRRNEARKQLNAWIALFGISLRKALANTPGQLAMLGLDTTLELQRRRQILLKKLREEKAKLDAAQARTNVPLLDPHEVQQLSAILEQAEQAVATASAMLAAEVGVNGKVMAA